MSVRLVQSRPIPNGVEDDLIGFIRTATAATDRIFVWGIYPDIYVRADRMPASRYNFCAFLTGLVPWVNAGRDIDTSSSIVTGTWPILMEELNRLKPVLLIDTSPGSHRAWGKYPIAKFPSLHEFVESNYVIATEILTDHGQVSFRVFRLASNPESEKPSILSGNDKKLLTKDPPR